LRGLIVYLDAFTVMLFGLLVKALLGALFFAFWMSSRSPWFAWWSAAYLIGAIAAALFMRGFGGGLLGIGIALPALLLAFGCGWQGARAFERRAPLWLPLSAGPAIWFAACLLPGFLENTVYRVALSSALIAPLSAAAAWEFWRGRRERLPSRWTVIVLFSSLALLFVVRIPLIPVAPFPFGALPAQPSTAALFNVIMFFHTMLLSVLLVALTKERLEFDQRTKAQTDPLTGALNRRAFMAVGHRLVMRHERKGEPLCLLFIDLDHFKLLNDRYGHSGGDDVLTRFVQFVQLNIRPTDFLFRLGGEEFCCLLPYTGPQEALGVAERIRRELQRTLVEVAGTRVNLTVSIGIASTAVFGYDLDTLVRRADMAVYVAKREGRNRVVVAEADEIAVVEKPASRAAGTMAAAK
jgi:diguanylate cyclase (GGDEF)-like protein